MLKLLNFYKFKNKYILQQIKQTELYNSIFKHFLKNNKIHSIKNVIDFITFNKTTIFVNNKYSKTFLPVQYFSNKLNFLYSQIFLKNHKFNKNYFLFLKSLNFSILFLNYNSKYLFKFCNYYKIKYFFVNIVFSNQAFNLFIHIYLLNLKKIMYV